MKRIIKGKAIRKRTVDFTVYFEIPEGHGIHSGKIIYTEDFCYEQDDRRLLLIKKRRR